MYLIFKCFVLRKQIKDVGVVDTDKATKDASKSASIFSSTCSESRKDAQGRRSLELRPTSTPASSQSSSSDSLFGARTLTNPPVNSLTVSTPAPYGDRFLGARTLTNPPVNSLTMSTPVPCGDSFFEVQNSASHLHKRPSTGDRKTSSNSGSLSNAARLSFGANKIDNSSATEIHNVPPLASNSVNYREQSHSNVRANTMQDQYVKKKVEENNSKLSNSLDNSWQSVESMEDRDFADEMEVALAFDDGESVHKSSTDKCGSSSSKALVKKVQGSVEEEAFRIDSSSEKQSRNHTRCLVNSFCSNADEEDASEIISSDDEDFGGNWDCQLGATASSSEQDNKSLEGNGFMFHSNDWFCGNLH